MKRSDLANAVYFELYPVSPSKGELRKLEIIGSAIECIAREGIYETSFESIGARIGIRRSHVAYHFNKIEEIFEACIRTIVATAQKVTVEELKKASATEWREQIGALVEGAFEWLTQHRSQGAVFVLFYSFCTHRKNYRSLHTQMREVGRERMKAILKNSFHSASPDAIEDLASTLQSLIFGSIVTQLTTENKKDQRAVIKAAACQLIESTLSVPKNKSRL